MKNITLLERNRLANNDEKNELIRMKTIRLLECNGIVACKKRI